MCPAPWWPFATPAAKAERLSRKRTSAATTIDGPDGVSKCSEPNSPPTTATAPMQRGEHRHLLGRRRKAPRRGGGNDQQRGDQQHADDLHGDGDDECHQQHEDEPRALGPQAFGLGQFLVDGRGQQRPPEPGQQATRMSSAAAIDRARCRRARRRGCRRTGSPSGRPAPRS